MTALRKVPWSGRSGLEERLAARSSDLSPTERKVAEFFVTNGADTVLLSALEIARRTSTSDATVIRTAKALGYSGLPELKLELGAELMDSTHPSRRLAMRLSAANESSAESLTNMMCEEAVDRIHETQRRFDVDEFDRALDIIEQAGAVMTFGVGISRVAAEYTALRLGRTGKRVHFAEHSGFNLADDLLQLGAGDVIIIFNPGRGLRELTVMIDHATKVGAKSILITGWFGVPPSGPDADVVLHAPGSPGGLTGELLTASITADMLVLGIAKRHEAKATAVSRKLNELRRGIVGRRID